MSAAYEQLGAFYLGRRVEESTGEVTGETILYDAKDLTTHAVCVGMTGSGKTGLGVVLLEEAAIDGIPILAIDPKGDLGNLLLTFPDLAPSDFAPWVDAGEAARKGRTPEEHATFLSGLWRKGLGDWDQEPERIGRYAGALERTIYTPGSRAGVPLAILRSLDAPPEAIRGDDEAMRDRVQSAVSGLLALLGVAADPLRSREHILVSTIVDRAWRAGRNLDLPSLIRAIQAPGFDKVGVFDLESFYPADDRFQLAMTLNNLLASPGFGVWSEGDPLDIGRLLYTPEGKPRLSILSIAHLSESERMFFVTLLLNELVTWTRSQPGTRSLRALLYMDEIFGYFPPTANPPSKRPMLTLLKQARAYGVGVVLATQNPVDLDYKGLSNTGTWFLGRLQTERDKLRILDGLEGAASGAAFDRSRTEQLLSSLDSRVFLMNNVHEDGPVLFHTRWALSYLGGPLTRDQIQRLMADRTAAPAPTPKREAVAAPPAMSAAGGAAPAGEMTIAAPPVLDPDVPQAFLEASRTPTAGERLLYRPALLGRATLHHVNARAKVDQWSERVLLAPLEDKPGPKPWREATTLDAVHLSPQPEPEAGFADLPKAAGEPSSYRRWEKMLKTHLYAEHPLSLWKCPKLKLISRPGESEGDFRARVADQIRERRDLAVEKLRARYAPKLARVEEQIQRAEIRVEKEQSQKRQHGLSAAVSVGATVIGALFGRKLASAGNVSRAGSAIRSAGRVQRESADIAHARAKVERLAEKLATLEEEFTERVDAVKDDHVPDAFPVEAVSIAPRKSDLTVDQLSLVWVPWIVDGDGIAEEAR